MDSQEQRPVTRAGLVGHAGVVSGRKSVLCPFEGTVPLAIPSLFATPPRLK